MKYHLNKEQSVKLDEKYLAWQILDKENRLICEFRGPQAMMCCMAALNCMNDSNYSMSKAIDIYCVENGGFV